MKSSSDRRIWAVLAFTSVLASVPWFPAATRTWVGLGSDGLWTTPANWSGGTVPAASDDVIFLNSAVQKGTVNNLVTSLHSITFGGGGFSISGNTLVLTNGIKTTRSTGANVFVPPVILGADQTFS